MKHFGNDGGSIINIGSMSSERFSAGAVAYIATKAGITGVTGVLAVSGPTLRIGALFALSFLTKLGSAYLLALVASWRA